VDIVTSAQVVGSIEFLRALYRGMTAVIRFGRNWMPAGASCTRRDGPRGRIRHARRVIRRAGRVSPDIQSHSLRGHDRDALHSERQKDPINLTVEPVR